jgi:DNA-binding NtrC family response regulator
MGKPLQIGDLATLAPADGGDNSQPPEISPKLHVLVVDDELLIRWSLVETLEQAGHRVAEAADAASAVRAVAVDSRFDVVVLDFRLPDSNDLNLLRTIKDASPTTAVVMMTAFGAPDIAAGARRLGAYCVVPKPFEVDHIGALVVEAYRGGVPAGNTHERSQGDF